MRDALCGSYRDQRHPRFRSRTISGASVCPFREPPLRSAKTSGDGGEDCPECRTPFSSIPSSILPTAILSGTGNWMNSASRRSKSSRSGGVRSSSRRFRSRGSEKAHPSKSRSFSMRERDFRQRLSNTIRPRSSTNCGCMWINGGRCRTRTNGRSARKPCGCSSIGGIIRLVASARFSVRSKRRKPPSG